MPTLEEDLQSWNRTYDWSKEGGVVGRMGWLRISMVRDHIPPYSRVSADAHGPRNRARVRAVDELPPSPR